MFTSGCDILHFSHLFNRTLSQSAMFSPEKDMQYLKLIFFCLNIKSANINQLTKLAVGHN